MRASLVARLYLCRRGRQKIVPSKNMGSFAKLIDEVRNVSRSAGAQVGFTFCSSIARNWRDIMATRGLGPADQGMPPGKYAFSVDAHSVIVRSDDFSGARELYARRVYFPSEAYPVGAGNVVFDLGANVGLFSTLAAVAGARVFAVEAQDEFRSCIESNLALNNCEARVTIEIGLLGAGTGLFGDAEAMRSASHLTQMPQQLDLGGIMRAHGVERIDFLKCDIEGAEFGLFGGESSWLDVTQRIAMEVHGKFGDPSVLVEQLRKKGFSVELRDPQLTVISYFEPGQDGYVYARRL